MNPETTTGGRALKFYSSVRMEIRRTGSIKDKDSVVGNNVKIKIVKNKVAPPFKEVETAIMFGVGIDKLGEIIDLASDNDIVKKSGAWYSYGEQRLGQGRENAKAFLLENPDIYKEIEDKCLEVLGIKSVDEE